MKGFSLIEMLVYLSLLSLLISGALASAYATATFSATYRTETRMEHDGRFMVYMARTHLQAYGTNLLTEKMESLTRYQVTDIEISESGDGSVESPRHTHVFFTLDAGAHATPLRRSFHTTFYPNAP